MIPDNLIKEQLEIREVLNVLNDWETKYLKEYSEGKNKWKTLRIKHLKRFEPFGIGNIMLENNKLEEEFLTWVKSDDIPSILYWKSRRNYNFLKKNEKYSFDLKNIDAGMENQVKEMNKAASEGNIEGFGVSTSSSWWKFW